MELQHEWIFPEHKGAGIRGKVGFTLPVAKVQLVGKWPPPHDPSGFEVCHLDLCDF